MVSCFSWFFVGFSGFSRWLCGYYGFWLVSLVFKVVSTILLGYPGFLGGFCFFMVSCMIWKASVCHVEKTPKPDRLNCIKGTTIQSRPASTTNCRFLLFAKSCANYGNRMGTLLSRKPSWTPEFGPEQWWLATPDVMFMLCPFRAWRRSLFRTWQKLDCGNCVQLSTLPSKSFVQSWLSWCGSEKLFFCQLQHFLARPYLYNAISDITTIHEARIYGMFRAFFMMSSQNVPW